MTLFILPISSYSNVLPSGLEMCTKRSEYLPDPFKTRRECEICLQNVMVVASVVYSCVFWGWEISEKKKRKEMVQRKKTPVKYLK